MCDNKNCMALVIGALNHQTFSTIPVILSQLMRISRDPNASARDLARVCERDLGTSSRLLRTANSVYFGRRVDQPKVTNISDAIVRVGFRKAHEIIMSASVALVMRVHSSIVDYSATGLWKHSIAVGISNRLLYKKIFGEAESLDPFLGGLLHDVGVAIEHQFLMQTGFGRAVEQRYVSNAVLSETEFNNLGFTHEELGKALAEEWNFPAYIIELIGSHHNTDIAADHPWAPLIRINQVSEWLCFSLGMGYSDFSKTHADQLAHSKKFLDISDEDIQQVGGVLHKEMEALTRTGWFEIHHRTAA